LHIKSAEQGRRKCIKPVERERGMKIAEVKLRRRTPTKNRGKKLKQTAALIDYPANLQTSSLSFRSQVCSLHLPHHAFFLLCVCTVQVNFNSLEQ